MKAIINFQCTPEQKELWVKQAQKEGLTLSAWIKKTLNQIMG